MWAIITQRHYKKETDDHRDVLENTYIQYFKQFGITLAPISNVIDDISVVFKDLPIEGIILSGGDDIEPTSYGGDPTLASSVSQERDRIENELLEYAIKENIPVLGICRGLQRINVFFGGTLVQNLSKGGPPHPPGKDHAVSIIDSKLIELVGRDTANVNSYHDHGVTIETLSKDLIHFSLSGNIVEGLYHPNYRIAAIQWHPERRSPESDINKVILELFKQSKLFWKNMEE